MVDKRIDPRFGTKGSAQNLEKSASSQRHTKRASNKETRKKLTTESGLTLEFESNLALNHARNYRAASLFIPLLIILFGFLSLTWMNYFVVMVWMVFVLSTHALLFIQNTRYIKLANEPSIKQSKWRHRLVVCDLLSGIAWASYLIVPLELAHPTQTIFVFSSFIIVVAVYSFTTAPLFHGMLASTVPITLMILANFIASKSPTLTLLAALFVAAQLLFIIFGRHIQQTLVRIFMIQNEKDELILDLEEAKAFSEESRRRAEAANLAKSRFLATMSHELRTPLNAILGFSEIMKHEVLGPLDNPSYVEYTADIHSSGQHLLNLINEILDLSRIEAGKYELTENPVDLIEVVEDCQALMQLRSQKKNIEIELVSEKTMPRIWADERAIRQIVLNLLSNAVKFTPDEGEIVVRVGWTAGGAQYVSVTDSGPGIPEDEIPVVLSQFGQGSLAIKSAEQGTGLGLPIVQALINMHGGTFDLTSKLDVGTRVTITIPPERIMQALAPMREENRVANHGEHRYQ